MASVAFAAPPSSARAASAAPSCSVFAVPADLKGGSADFNAASLIGVLEGAKNAYRGIALLNTAGALIVAGKVKTLADGAALAAKAIDSGAAKATLAKLIKSSNTAA